MPFPPTFADAWDITQPPDTQLANLLGQDIRNLKLDIMQRLSLLSGTIANRPTPETVNATWGGSGFGMLYFATDTQVIYQWNGSAWNAINFSTSPKIFDATVYTSPSTTGGNQLTISAVSGSVAKGVVWGNALSGSGTPQVNISLNGNSLTSPINVAAGGNWRVDYDVVFTSTSQIKSVCTIFALGTGSYVVEASYSSLTPPFIISGSLTSSGLVTVSQAYQYTIQYA